MSAPSRQPGGIPIGGEFAPAARPASGVAIGPEQTGSAMTEQEQQIDSMLSESIRARREGQRRIEALSLKMLGLGVQRRFPDARSMTLEDSDQRLDTFCTGVLLDEAGTEIAGAEQELFDEFNHLVDNLDAEGASYVDVATQDDGGAWTLDLGKCAAIEIEPPPQPVPAAGQSGHHHEQQQIRSDGRGGHYCAACGESVPDHQRGAAS